MRPARLKHALIVEPVAPTPYTLVFSHRAQSWVKNILLALAVVAFAIQLVLYAIRLLWPGIPLPDRFMPVSFLDTIHTPLTLILVYEAYLLVTSTSRSIIEFVSKQFEVVSLIILRGIFKDLSSISHTPQVDIQSPAIWMLGLSLLGSLVLYYLIEIFERFQVRYATAELSEEPPGLTRGKQGLSLALGVAFTGISLYYFVMWMSSHASGLETAYFRQFFTLLVIFDIAHLILSMYYLRSYTLLYEYSAFILASAIVLIALPMSTPIKLLLILSALVFCIITIRLHAYTREHEAGLPGAS